ncbi:MAG: hypothetical protein ABW143_12055, partial [Acidimicrobiales bacterium]
RPTLVIRSARRFRTGRSHDLDPAHPDRDPAAGIRSRPVPLAPVTDGDTALATQLEASQFVAV